MNKKQALIPFAVFVSLGLTACGSNGDTAVQDRNTEVTQPMGYYSNEHHEEQDRGNARLLTSNDNDGPIVEMMDHSLGEERGHQRDGTYSRADRNYHKHLGDPMKTPRSSYYQSYDGATAENVSKAASRVENVKDAQALLHGDEIVIAAMLENQNNDTETKKSIQQAVRPLIGDRSVHILTNESQYNRIKVLNNDLKDGGMREQIDLDVENLFKDLNH
ncbi:YhcN/YlaJ family sporulation lipoprotein [Cytobacillus gottheilii]|uniref:YhcN/YlaJ family sporulation lipoprotein n=1 Tax=Cytobacillus gottheilii TaxID=859144 RepID=UPI0015947525|nr:YhcN/YlaJ family sporulation lipoprotein [Cytobacillus gottheilii]